MVPNEFVGIDDVVKFSNGAVEYAGLAPTIVACVSSCFAVLFEIEKPFGPIVVYLLLFFLLGFPLVRFLSGQSFLELDDSAPEFGLFFWRKTPSLGTAVVSQFVYLANSTFILYVVVLYFIYGEPWSTCLKSEAVVH